jgi:hypothetical protein
MNWNLRYAIEQNEFTPKESTNEVVDQLSKDYPEKSLDWVKENKWTGPQLIHVMDVDFSNYKTWRAAHEPEKINKFKKKIKKGVIKPVILVKTPKNEKYIIADGHHRSLAYRELGGSVVAYVTNVDRETGPWDEFHSMQGNNDSGGGTDE